jgi:zinc transport system permease protein
MIEVLSYGFMQNAVLAALLASIACGLIGTMVVVNRMVFLAGGIAHTAYGGVGLAFYTGLPVMPCTVCFTLGASLLMARFTFRQRRQIETIIGMFWAAGMALGILLMDCTSGYQVNLMSYLFGSILTVSTLDLWIMAGLDVILLLAILLFYKDFAAMSFDEDFALSRGAPVKFLYYLLMAMIAVTVVMVIQVVGLILVIALLTIPPYLAQLWIASFGQMMLKATLASMAFCLTGLWMAYSFDLTSGATIIAVATGCFFIVYSLKAIKSIRATQ